MITTDQLLLETEYHDLWIYVLRTTFPSNFHDYFKLAPENCRSRSVF